MTPQHSKQGSSVSAKGQVEFQGQHSVIQLTEQQQGFANTGARSKISASHVNSVLSFCAISKQCLSSVKCTRCEWTTGCASHGVKQGIPGLAYSSNSLASQIQ